MKIISQIRNANNGAHCLICIIILVLMNGCYSFTGGTIPEHLKSITIVTAGDNSGYGNPRYKLVLTESLIEGFRRDNSLKLTETEGDARLNVVINQIIESTSGVSAGEIEKERRVTITCSAEYYDYVKKKLIWKKDFTNYGTFSLTNAQSARDEAIQTALKQLSDDILLAVVSGW